MGYLEVKQIGVPAIFPENIILRSRKGENYLLPANENLISQLLCVLGENTPNENMFELYILKECGKDIESVYFLDNRGTTQFHLKDKTQIKSCVCNSRFAYLNPSCKIYFIKKYSDRPPEEFLSSCAFYDIENLKIPELPKVEKNFVGEKRKPQIPIPIPRLTSVDMTLISLEKETNPSDQYFIPIKFDLLLSKKVMEKLFSKIKIETKILKAQKEILLKTTEEVETKHKQPYIFLLELFEKVNLQPEKVLIEVEKLDQKKDENITATLCTAKKSYLRYNKSGETKTIPFDYEIALMLAFLKDLEVYLEESSSFECKELV